mmetsp:Transcript_66403/g.167381  ORF Transcript_66403/g.167381 Transcript_66403/m.167381 type:complete len:238 (-) Transcript_66403:1166-1879(-)
MVLANTMARSAFTSRVSKRADASGAALPASWPAVPLPGAMMGKLEAAASLLREAFSATNFCTNAMTSLLPQLQTKSGKLNSSPGSVGGGLLLIDALVTLLSSPLTTACFSSAALASKLESRSSNEAARSSTSIRFCSASSNLSRKSCRLSSPSSRSFASAASASSRLAVSALKASLPAASASCATADNASSASLRFCSSALKASRCDDSAFAASALACSSCCTNSASRCRRVLHSAS